MPDSAQLSVQLRGMLVTAPGGGTGGSSSSKRSTALAFSTEQPRPQQQHKDQIKDHRTTLASQIIPLCNCKRFWVPKYCLYMLMRTKGNTFNTCNNILGLMGTKVFFLKK